MSQELPVRPSSTASQDGFLQQEVIAALRQNARVPKDRVSVAVHGGIATLQGIVTWKYEGAAAATAAAGVPGITAIDNRLTVEMS
jgi:osmotically-inducible protein OsmY